MSIDKGKVPLGERKDGDGGDDSLMKGSGPVYRQRPENR